MLLTTTARAVRIANLSRIRGVTDKALARRAELHIAGITGRGVSDDSDYHGILAAYEQHQRKTAGADHQQKTDARARAAQHVKDLYTPGSPASRAMDGQRRKRFHEEYDRQEQARRKYFHVTAYKSDRLVADFYVAAETDRGAKQRVIDESHGTYQTRDLEVTEVSAAELPKRAHYYLVDHPGGVPVIEV